MADKMEEMDRLRLSLAIERQKRLELSLLLAKSAAAKALDESVKQKLLTDALRAELSKRYNLKPNDKVDEETGEITRGPIPLVKEEAP